MQFRRATVDDIRELIALDPIAATDSDRARQIETWVAEQSCYVLDDSGIRAYGVLNRQFHGQPFVEMLIVGARHRRTGYGTTLLQNLRGIVPDEPLWTSTNRSNGPMRSLLVGLGFELRGEVDIDPGDPEFYFCVRKR